MQNYYMNVVGLGTHAEVPAISFDDVQDPVVIAISEYMAQCAGRTFLGQDAEPWDQQIMFLGSNASPPVRRLNA